MKQHQLKDGMYVHSTTSQQRYELLNAANNNTKPTTMRPRKYNTGDHVYILPTKQCGVIEGYNLPEMKDRYKVNGRYYRKSQLIPADIQVYFERFMKPHGWLRHDWWYKMKNRGYVIRMDTIIGKPHLETLPSYVDVDNGIISTLIQATKHHHALKAISEYNNNLNQNK